MPPAQPRSEEPGQLDALVALAQQQQREGRLAEAAATYGQILALQPDFAEAHFHLALLCHRQGQLDEALPHYQRVLALRPEYPDAINNLGVLFAQQEKHDLSIAQFERMVALRPNHAEAHYNLANALKNHGQLERAAASYQQALAYKPGYAEAYNNLGNVLRDLGRLDEAATQYQHALMFNSGLPDVHYNLGNVRQIQRRFGEASASYQQALALRPDYPQAQLALAECYLVQGDYQHGWPAYEGRLRIPRFMPIPNCPRWGGEPLAGRSLLLVAEPGLGSTLHFVRYARLLKERGARVVLAAHAALGRLLSSHPDLDELVIVDPQVELPRCDFYLPLVSAPGMLGTRAGAIPANIPYLWADPALTDKWREELAGVDGYRIGIVWQGSPRYPVDRWRSMPLVEFRPLAQLPGVRLISLQKGLGSEQVAAVDFPVLDLSDRLDEAAGPFMDTAAVMRNLDLIVTADSAAAHLAGALGVPVWVALQFSPYWPWLLEREDTPWYPTMRLFRQATFDGWSDVFERMAQAIQRRHSESASGR